MSSPHTSPHNNSQWHDPDAFFEVGNVLEKHGYTNVYVNTASVGSTKPLDDPFEDTKIVRKHILKALDEDGHDVVLAMHSYGGVPGTNAAHGLGKKQREAEGSKTGVINLAYIAVSAPRNRHGTHTVVKLQQRKEQGCSAEHIRAVLSGPMQSKPSSAGRAEHY